LRRFLPQKPLLTLLPASLVRRSLSALLPRGAGCCGGLAHQLGLNCSTHCLKLQPGCYAPSYTWLKHLLQYGCMRGALLHNGGGGGGGVWPLAGRGMTVSDHPSPSGGREGRGECVPPSHLSPSVVTPWKRGRECWGAADQTQEGGRTTSGYKG